MNYGFLIDNRSCIGCHACSTACKSENEVPLGVYRTWVKQVEHGAFGEAQRHFQVTRCNHCAKPPCVTICPVTAMYKRPDGIVEFDGDVCIGCKACLQACPYDAIYIDPETHTAAKCHFCAHRTDLGLEPACVVVCPTQAIVAGDLDDPDSRIRRLLQDHPTSVRRPEQGTAPKLFYIDAHEVTLNPLAAPAPGNMAFTSLIDERAGMRAPTHSPSSNPTHPPQASYASHSSYPSHLSAPPTASSHPARPPAQAPAWQTAGPMASNLTRLTYNAQHKVPWHWQVPAYLVTKAIASGMFMIMAAVWLLGLSAFDRRTALVGNGVALLFLAITTVLLVADLERPERFLRILTRPQWKSWLTRGAFILIGFSLVCTLWFALELGAQLGWVAEGVAEAARVPLMALGFPLALLTAIYTAFLFQQCEGRDLWQSRLMPWHMGVQAVMAGGAVWAALAGLTGRLMEMGMVTVPLVVAILADLFFRIAEVGRSHGTANGRQAAWLVREGRLQAIWRGSLALSVVAGIAMLTLFASILAWLTGVVVMAADESDAIFSDAASSSMETLITTVSVVTPWVTTSASILALVGLFLYESAIIKAGQDVPNA